jgi:hypothetical protein
VVIYRFSHLAYAFLISIYSQTCICKLLKGTWKCYLNEQLPFILYAHFINEKMIRFDFDWIFFCLTPLSAISWRPILVVEEARVPGENHQPWENNCKLYHLRLRVEWTLFVIYKAGREPTPYWWYACMSC